MFFQPWFALTLSTFNLLQTFNPTAKVQDAEQAGPLPKPVEPSV